MMTSSRTMADDELRPDIAAAWNHVKNKTGKKRDVRKILEYLNQGETVLAMTGGTVDARSGLLIATNRRALFVSEGVINHSFEDFPYDRITTVTNTKGLALGKILIQASGAARTVTNVAKAEAEAVAEVIRERVESVTRERYTAPASPSVASAPVGLAAELRELAELKNMGVLTEEEFATQKARLLGR